MERTKNKTLDRRDHMLGGVAGGLAHYLDADPTLIRLLIVALTVAMGPVIPVLYIAAWIIVPDGRRVDTTPPPPAPPAPPAGAPSPAAETDIVTS